MKSIKAITGDRETVTVERLTSVKEAARVMTENRIGCVPVLDGDRLVGIFTERDVMGRVVAAGWTREDERGRGDVERPRRCRSQRKLRHVPARCSRLAQGIIIALHSLYSSCHAI